MTVRCPSNGRRASLTSGLLAPAAQTSAGRASCSCIPWSAAMRRRPPRPYYSHRWPGHPSTHPHPLLFCGDGSLTPQRANEPSYSSTCGHPLPCLPRLRVVPFLGLAVVHRPGALRAAWSTWSRNDFHRSTVRGEADSWDPHGPWPRASKYLLIRPKIMNTPNDSWDPLAISWHRSASLLRSKNEYPPASLWAY